MVYPFEQYALSSGFVECQRQGVPRRQRRLATLPSRGRGAPCLYTQLRPLSRPPDWHSFRVTTSRESCEAQASAASAATWSFLP